MAESEWEVVYETDGQLQAELLRGLLEAQEIPVVLSQEGIGRVYGLTVGPLAIVQILVPGSKVERARDILRKYESGGGFDIPDSDETGKIQQNRIKLNLEMSLPAIGADPPVRRPPKSPSADGVQ